MEQKIIPSSELIINSDGSVFHLHLRPEMLTDRVILVGDPARVDIVASFFDSKTFEVSSREFHTIGGTYQGKPIMCLSHGIGPDNIDIVINELDALANINFETREINPAHRQLTLVRIGTSGALQPELKLGTPVIAEKSIGFDGVLNYYAGRNEVADLDFEKAFIEKTAWNSLWANPYVVDADAELVDRIGRDDMVRGNTISAVGFYGPQGRQLRLPFPAVAEDGWYSSKEEVALYIHLYGHLPGNYVTKRQAQDKGWSGGSVERYTGEGTAIGGSRFGNYEGLLPEAEGRSYQECDIDTVGASSRGPSGSCTPTTG